MPSPAPHFMFGPRSDLADFEAAKAEVARLRGAIEAASAGAKIIAAVAAREVYDSRGNPTVEVELTMNDGSVRTDARRRHR